MSDLTAFALTMRNKYGDSILKAINISKSYAITRLKVPKPLLWSYKPAVSIHGAVVAIIRGNFDCVLTKYMAKKLTIIIYMVKY
jgi:hypothetical protein